MTSIAAFLLVILPCLPAGAAVFAVAPVAPVEAAPMPLSSAMIAKAIDLYNSANAAPRFLGLGSISSRLFVSAAEADKTRPVEPKEIPALLAQGRSVTIKHSALIMDTEHAQPPTVFLSSPKTVSTLDQLREWAEGARFSLGLGGFDGALVAASK